MRKIAKLYNCHRDKSIPTNVKNVHFRILKVKQFIPSPSHIRAMSVPLISSSFGYRDRALMPRRSSMPTQIGSGLFDNINRALISRKDLSERSMRFCLFDLLRRWMTHSWSAKKGETCCAFNWSVRARMRRSFDPSDRSEKRATIENPTNGRRSFATDRNSLEPRLVSLCQFRVLASNIYRLLVCKNMQMKERKRGGDRTCRIGGDEFWPGSVQWNAKSETLRHVLDRAWIRLILGCNWLTVLYRDVWFLIIIYLWED